MSYDKTVWETGDVITAEKLNKNENATGVYLYYVDVQVGESEQVNVVITKEGNVVASPDEVLTIVKNNALVLFNYRDTPFPVMYISEDSAEGFAISGLYLETGYLTKFALSYYYLDGQTGFNYSETTYELSTGGSPT